MTRREFLGEEFFRACTADYEALRREAHAQRGAPDPYQRVLVELRRVWEQFYRAIL